MLAMAYDEELAERIRDLLGPLLPKVVEKKMFGGLAFMVDGNMSVSASGQGGLLVHVDPDEGAKLISRKGVEPMVMRGKEMRGWLRVDTAAVKTDAALREWIDRGVAYARSLPAK